MKVVVTGATGHLGRALCATLGDVVRVARGGELALDLTSDACIEPLAAALGPDVALVHLAAWHPPATASTTPEDRTRLIETNVLGAMRALDAARQAGARCVVYASSFEVYGEPREATIDEAHRTYPLTDYGATKLSGEHHLAAFAYEEQVRTVSLRMPAIYGPGEITSRALPNFLKQVAAGERPVIFGDGLDQRDQLHVDDAARAIRCALERGEGVYNVADGEAHTIEEIATIACRLGELDVPERRPREKPRRDFHMSIEKARAELGFSPEVSLEDGMRGQLAWLRA